MSGEGASRADITIPRAQLDLAEAVAATGKPLIVLLKHGRALELSGAVKDAQAIVCTWFLGSESGNPIADILFGDHAPQGRLPISFPQRAGQQPFFYNHRSSGRPDSSQGNAFAGARYREVPNRALYPFGHGLGYSTVSYAPTQVDKAEFPRDGSVRVRARVTNSGPVAQHEVAQLYVRIRSASIVQPVRALKGIRHLDLQPGESATVEFAISAAELSYVHADLATRADAGMFDVWIAPSAEGGSPAMLRMAG
jgi:beta-glucosidase